MRTLTLTKNLSRTKVELFDSVNDLTADRYQEFQCLSLEDVGIGSNMEAVGKHFSQLHLYISNKKLEEAWEETKNLHNNIYFMVEKINSESYCFAPFIHTINNKEAFPGFNPQSYTHENVKRVLKELSQAGLKQSQVTDILDDIKKNLIQSFEPIFLIDTPIPDQLTSTPN